jgi:outer membrane protein OmpA-like peptidoglycan-associated protein
MKTRTLAAALAALVASAPAFAGPDFVTPDRAQPLAASDAHSDVQPQDDITFGLESAALSPTAQIELRSVARWLDSHPRYHLVLRGHTSSSGPVAYNLDLATRRLAITHNHLIDLGVAEDRIVVALYGEIGARLPPESVDRRVVLYASTAPVAGLVAAELDRNARELSWTRHGSVFRESRGITPLAVAQPARNRPVGPHGG